jgi:hypothetical protein
VDFTRAAKRLCVSAKFWRAPLGEVSADGQLRQGAQLSTRTLAPPTVTDIPEGRQVVPAGHTVLAVQAWKQRPPLPTEGGTSTPQVPLSHCASTLHTCPARPTPRVGGAQTCTSGFALWGAR